MVTISVSLPESLEWRLQTLRSGQRLLSCESLGLSLEVLETEDYLALAREATDGLLHDLLVDGDLDDFLDQMGWSATIPGWVNPGVVRFAVPIKIIEKKVVALG